MSCCLLSVSEVIAGPSVAVYLASSVCM